MRSATEKITEIAELNIFMASLQEIIMESILEDNYTMCILKSYTPDCRLSEICFSCSGLVVKIFFKIEQMDW